MPIPLTDQLRRAIKKDGRSLYAIAKQSGLTVSALQRFVAKEHGMTLLSAEKLVDALGLRLTLTKQKGR